MFIESVEESAATGEVAAYYAEQKAAWGFLPNYAACFAARPEVARAWAVLNLTIRGGMDRRRFEIATIAAARARRSTYCTTAHSTFLRDVCGDAQAVLAIGADPTGAALDPVDAAVFRFATTVATDASAVDQADVDELRRHGLSDTDVADVVLAVAARLFFTSVLDGLGAQLDVQTAQQFDDELLASMIVGRPPAD
ncbi:carboxymuconolactone decarboxylase family protein [Ornithinimicrobium cavernae]|uniref:carboxymuconolactone decarboxylase family protein n=1 Tax=Ornithinimicrobium cavernae TaxID=2666047 RepID=UPI000D69C141|nr:carboxymuconolactone decarboxylase family protein [Ornithinimicrobium cavernae]